MELTTLEYIVFGLVLVIILIAVFCDLSLTIKDYFDEDR